MAMTEAAQPTRRYRLGALAHRNFRLFFIGQGISLVGTWLQNVGEGWLILTLTNSPFYVGLTSALSSVGVLLFSLYAGVIADRVDKRRVIVFMQLAFMIEPLTVSSSSGRTSSRSGRSSCSQPCSASRARSTSRCGRRSGSRWAVRESRSEERRA